MPSPHNVKEPGERGDARVRVPTLLGIWATNGHYPPDSSQEVAQVSSGRGVASWKSLPSWYLVAANDQAIPLDAERQFAQRLDATTVGGGILVLQLRACRSRTALLSEQAPLRSLTPNRDRATNT